MEVKEKLERIEEKIKSLGDRYQSAKTDNKRLKVESDVLREKISEQEELIKQLENKNVNLHIARKGVDTSASSDTLRKKIDQYIKEIDKCIELLNS